MSPDEAKKLMRRTKRAAQTLRDGAEILEFFQREEIRELLVEGIDEEVPPVSKVSALLLEEFGQDVKQMPVRQFCGMAVKAVLAKEGYVPEDTGVRIHDDAVFSSGATYAKVVEEEAEIDDGDILRAMVATLSQPQLERLRDLVDAVML